MENELAGQKTPHMSQKQKIRSRNIISAEIYTGISLGPGGVVTRDRVVIIETAPSSEYMLKMFTRYMLAGIFVYIVLNLWKKYHKRSNEIFKWFLLMAFPFFYNFPALAILFCYIVAIIFIHRRKPKYVLKLYFYFFKTSAILGFFIMLLIIASIIMRFNFIGPVLAFISLIYLATITREIAKISNWNFQQIDFGKNGQCCICNVGHHKSDVLLNCNHSFHNQCLEGFT